MLAIPEVGFNRSVNVHNIRLDVFTDWIEASILFTDPRVSSSDVIDILCENYLYDDSDNASAFVSVAWKELRRRQAWLGKFSPLRVHPRFLERRADWVDVPAHSFCLVLSCLIHYKTWAKQFGSDYTIQGKLFEDLSKESLESLGWVVHTTGWASTRTTKLSVTVEGIADALNEPTGQIGRWSAARAKDAGLDLVCSRPFVDKRGGKPVYLLQCASGADWPQKVHTPDLNLWNKLIDFSSPPQRAFAMPFSFTDDAEFSRVCNRVSGMLIDRYRLLSAGWSDPNWLSVPLAKKLMKWLRPRVKKMPTNA